MREGYAIENSWGNLYLNTKKGLRKSESQADKLFSGPKSLTRLTKLKWSSRQPSSKKTVTRNVKVWDIIKLHQIVS